MNQTTKLLHRTPFKFTKKIKSTTDFPLFLLKVVKPSIDHTTYKIEKVQTYIQFRSKTPEKALDSHKTKLWIESNSEKDINELTQAVHTINDLTTVWFMCITRNFVKIRKLINLIL